MASSSMLPPAPGDIVVVKTVSKGDVVKTTEIKSVERRVVVGEPRLYLNPNTFPEMYIPESTLNRDILCIDGMTVRWSIKKWEE